MTLYFSGGISPLWIFSTISSSGGCGLSHSDRFRFVRPSFTSFITSHEAGATFVYHGHFVRLLWQSAHESVTIWFTVALWNTAACVTGGFA